LGPQLGLELVERRSRRHLDRHVHVRRREDRRGARSDDHSSIAVPPTNTTLIEELVECGSGQLEQRSGYELQRSADPGKRFHRLQPCSFPGPYLRAEDERSRRMSGIIERPLVEPAPVE